MTYTVQLTYTVPLTYIVLNPIVGIFLSMTFGVEILHQVEIFNFSGVAGSSYMLGSFSGSSLHYSRGEGSGR